MKRFALAERSLNLRLFNKLQGISNRRTAHRGARMGMAEGQKEEMETEREVRYVVDGTSAWDVEAVLSGLREFEELPFQEPSPEADREPGLEIMPEVLREEGRQEAPEASREDEEGRTEERKMNLGAAYVGFVIIMCALAIFACVRFLRLKEIVTTQRNAIAMQETRLTKLRSENDALLESLVNALDWEYIRDTAVNRLGMRYAGESQVEWYSTDGEGYVRQYREVPEA